MDPSWTLETEIPAPTLRGLEVLIWHDGPRIQVIEVDGVPHIGTWTDCDQEGVDRWMLARAEPSVIESLTAGILPIRDVFTRVPEVTIVDLTIDGSIRSAWRLPKEKIPSVVLAVEGAKLQRIP